MRTLYVEGTTWAHRLSPRAKLLALAAISIGLFLTRAPLPLGLAVTAGAAVLFGLRLGWRETVYRLRPILLTIAVVALFNLAFTSAEEAMVVLFRLTALTLFAAAVTATTSISEFINEITLAVRPLERLAPVRAEDIGLAAGLVIRFVPEIIGRYQAIREAHRARGLRARPLTLLVPLIILTLRDADSIAAAIDARGFRRQNVKTDLPHGDLS